MAAADEEERVVVMVVAVMVAEEEEEEASSLISPSIPLYSYAGTNCTLLCVLSEFRPAVCPFPVRYRSAR